MTWLAFWLSPMGLFVLYVLYIQHERGGVWVAFKLFGIPGYPLDVFYNLLLCAVFGRLPQKYTISVELPILAQIPGWRGDFAIALANFLNWFAPSGAHVRLTNNLR